MRMIRCSMYCSELENYNGGAEMKENRYGNSSRKSKETDVYAEVRLNGIGTSKISTGIGFFDHMIELMSAHGGFEIRLTCKGDLDIDGHHSIEDCGIVLGKAFADALGDKKGIARYGTSFVPMDESLAFVSIDISGRPHLSFQVPSMNSLVGGFDTQLLEEFFRAFSTHCALTLHVTVLYGKNSHHMIEAVFKAFGRALKQAYSLEGDERNVPSTKGIID